MALGSALVLSWTLAGAQVANAAPPANAVRLAINPAMVCTTTTNGSYPNFDLVIENGGPEDVQVEEVRALVRNAQGELIERRLLWQQAVNSLGTDRLVRAGRRILLFNPFTFTNDVAGKALTYEVVLAGRPLPLSVTTKPASCTNRERLMLPLEGRVLVYDGYDQLSHHRRGLYDDDWSRQMGISDNFQRFGLDLVVVDAAGHTFTGDGTRTDQWLGWGKPVRAAAAGVVAAVHDGQPDNVVIGTVDKWTDRPSAANPMSSYGNYVLVEHGPGEFTLVGHLKNGSVRVTKGERVAAEQVVGAVGNSGASGGVHVHFERRTGFGLGGITTLPAYFSGLKLVGAPRGAEEKPVAINSGDVVLAR